MNKEARLKASRVRGERLEEAGPRASGVRGERQEAGLKASELIQLAVGHGRRAMQASERGRAHGVLIRKP